MTLTIESAPLDLLNQADKLEVQACKIEIMAKLKRTIPDMITIGQRLIRIRDLLQPDAQQTGGFGAWIETDFDMSKSTAYRIMRNSERLSGREHLIDRVSPTVAVELGSCSPEVLDLIEEKLDQGQEVDIFEIKNLKDKFGGVNNRFSPIEVFSNGMRNLTRKHQIPNSLTTTDQVALQELREYCADTIKKIDQALKI